MNDSATLPPPAAPPASPIIAPIARPTHPKEKDVEQAFGKIEIGQDGRPTARWEGSTLTAISLPYPMRLAWEPAQSIFRMTCHRSISRDLSSIFGEIKRHYDGDLEKIKAARMDLFGGCYGFGRKHGGNGLSIHSWGIGLDLDPERNPLGKPWKKDSGMMPAAVVDIFLAHGWTWGGLWKGNSVDAMHFQATQAL